MLTRYDISSMRQRSLPCTRTSTREWRILSVSDCDLQDISALYTRREETKCVNMMDGSQTPDDDLVNGMTIKIDKSGRIVVPKALRVRLGLKPDMELEVHEQVNGMLLRVPALHPTMVRVDGLWVHQGTAQTNADWACVLRTSVMNGSGLLGQTKRRCRCFFDTTVLVAASEQSQPHHARALPALRRIVTDPDAGFISIHSIAETYAALTPALGAASDSSE